MNWIYENTRNWITLGWYKCEHSRRKYGRNFLSSITRLFNCDAKPWNQMWTTIKTSGQAVHPRYRGRPRGNKLLIAKPHSKLALALKVNLCNIIYGYFQIMPLTALRDGRKIQNYTLYVDYTQYKRLRANVVLDSILFYVCLILTPFFGYTYIRVLIPQLCLSLVRKG